MSKRAVVFLSSRMSFAFALPFTARMTEVDHSDETGRILQYEGCNDCVQGDNLYTGDCGAFANENDEWCGPICCAPSESDCCDVNGGAVAGLIIGIVALIAIITVASCYCCSCCPLYKRGCGKGGDNQSPPPVQNATASSAGTTTVTETILGDGSKVVEKKTVMPDGSVVVETSTEKQVAV